MALVHYCMCQNSCYHHLGVDSDPCRSTEIMDISGGHWYIRRSFRCRGFSAIFDCCLLLSLLVACCYLQLPFILHKFIAHQLQCITWYALASVSLVIHCLDQIGLTSQSSWYCTNFFLLCQTWASWRTLVNTVHRGLKSWACQRVTIHQWNKE